MYSGNKNQNNIQADLASRARRASLTLDSNDAGKPRRRTAAKHSDVRDKVSFKNIHLQHFLISKHNFYDFQFKQQRKQSILNQHDDLAHLQRPDGEEPQKEEGMAALKSKFGHQQADNGDDSDDDNWLDDLEGVGEFRLNKIGRIRVERKGNR